MGVAQLVGIAGSWVLVVVLVLGGLIIERRRRPRSRSEGPAGVAAADWFVVEEAGGASAEVAERARFLARAWLATRGLDPANVRPDDIRTEVTTAGDGVRTIRVLFKSAALQASLPRR